MILNNALMSPETFNNYKNFDNMWRRLQCASDRATYTAVLVVDKVKLERNSIRSFDVDNWYDDIFDGRRHPRQPQPCFCDWDNEEVSDIED